MIDAAVKEKCDCMLAAIKMSDEFKKYIHAKEELKLQPELAKRVEEFRKLSYELQTAANNEDAYEKNEVIENMYDDFRKESIVIEYLNAETALCRMLQEINRSIVELLDLRLGF